MGGWKSLTGALVVLVLTLVISGGVSGANMQEQPTLAVSSTEVTEGATTTISVTLSHLPNGLAGFELELRLSNPTVASITNVTVKPTFSLQSTTIPAEGAKATVKGVDIENTTIPGATNVALATITLYGTESGTTELYLDPHQIDADDGTRITPMLQNGTLTVTGTTTQGMTTTTTTTATTRTKNTPDSSQTTTTSLDSTTTTTTTTTALNTSNPATNTTTSTSKTSITQASTQITSTTPGQPTQAITKDTTPTMQTTETTRATTPQGVFPTILALLSTWLWYHVRRTP